MFQTINVKRTLSVRIEQCDLEAYLDDNGWQKTIDGWALNHGREIMGCLGLQMTVEQLAFVEKRDSFLVFQDIEAFRKNRIAEAWNAAIDKHGVCAFELFCDDKELSFTDNDSVNREIECWGNVYLKGQTNESTNTAKEV
jgi:hypothetical protein